MNTGRSILVWCAVDCGMPVYHLLGAFYDTVERELDLCIPDWKEQGITIRRATLTVEAPKPIVRKR